jgi:hypothetical protein
MPWTPLKDAGSIKLIQKLAVLQAKLVELAAKQKMNGVRQKLSMLNSGTRNAARSK